MPKLSKASLAKLATCHTDLQRLVNEVIKEYDCNVIYGARTVAEQFKLFKIGRKQVKGNWQVVGKVVTNLDGTIKKSKHNYSPSLAVDLAPSPINWNNEAEFRAMGKLVKSKAVELGIEIVWGGDWKSFKDLPHFELKHA